MSDTKTSAGLRYAKLICVIGSETNNNNKVYIMEELPGGAEFKASWGRIEGHMSTKNYPMSQWDKIYKEKTTRTKEPYKDRTELLVVEAKSTGKKSGNKLFRDDRPKDVVDFAKLLQKHANASVKENYTISVEAVSQKQVDAAQDLINKISGMIKLKAKADPINEMLMDLYGIIPRKMIKVKDHLIQEPTIKNDIILQSVNDMLGKEQDTLDVMAGQVVVASQGIDVDDPDVTAQDLLDSLGLDITGINKTEEKKIKEMLNVSNNAKQYIRAFKMQNKETERLFNNHVKDAKNKKSSLLFHGSRNENWWFIMQQGLKLKPATAVITGKMFGHGTYFADKSQKSIGYTSLHGSYFARGSSNTALLALYDVHNGEEWDIFANGKRHTSEHTQLTYDKVKGKGYDSVFAKGGYDLRNNEFIVYNENQSNIRYLIEIGG